MKVHHGIKNLPEFNQAVLTIGSFDGVHIGHQKIINRINRLADEINGESVLITFHPHPRSIIYPYDDSLKLLNTIDEKLALFEAMEVDHVVIVPFSIEFSQQSAREYLEKFIKGCFNPAYVVIGYDHRYGLNRQGDIRLLKSFAAENNFEVLEIQKQEIEDIAISSSKIRTALKEGNIREANMFLGYPYKLTGNVVHGDKIGKTIGYPTANISIPDKQKLIPLFGVYAVLVTLDEIIYRGMLYIGNRPTINKKAITSMEVNIFDFTGQIYDEPIQIEIIETIRGDQKFETLESLKLQIDQDKKSTISILNKLLPEKKKIKQTSICILNYNGVEYLESYLPSVLRACTENCEVVVIDNGSSDESINFLEDWFPEVKIIPLNKNYGFAEGYNRGLNGIESPLVVLLNSDVRLTPDSIKILVEELEKSPNIAAIQPKIRSIEEPEKFEYAGAAGGMMDRLGYPYCRGRIMDEIEIDEGQYKSDYIHWTSGACMLIRTDVFKKIGGFDSGYFAHQEEIDLCWRIRRAGYQIICSDKSIVYHLGGGTLPYGNARKVFLNFRNNLSTILKNEKAKTIGWLFPLRLLLDGVAGMKFLFQGHFKSAWSVIRAHFYIYANLPTIMAKRRYYDKLITAYSVDNHMEKPSGIFSILYQYYILGRKTYSQLKQ